MASAGATDPHLKVDATAEALAAGRVPLSRSSARTLAEALLFRLSVFSYLSARAVADCSSRTTVYQLFGILFPPHHRSTRTKSQHCRQGILVLDPLKTAHPLACGCHRYKHYVMQCIET